MFLNLRPDRPLIYSLWHSGAEKATADLWRHLRPISAHDCNYVIICSSNCAFSVWEHLQVHCLHFDVIWSISMWIAMFLCLLLKSLIKYVEKSRHMKQFSPRILCLRHLDPISWYSIKFNFMPYTLRNISNAVTFTENMAWGWGESKISKFKSRTVLFGGTITTQMTETKLINN